jgi:NADPH2:quinone reductase
MAAMRAITVSEFGGPEVLRPREVPMPGPGPDEVLGHTRGKLVLIVDDDLAREWEV